MAVGDVARTIALNFAKNIGSEDEERLEAALSVACFFIAEKELEELFESYADAQVEVVEARGDLLCEAGESQAPDADFLRERIAKLRLWLANAERDLERAERWSRAER